MRSLITLKALTYEPTGGIVAAATTSLPEADRRVSRNWDYRYCWLRDATLTLESLMRGGYFDEAMAWRDWLLRAVAGDVSRLQIMYGPAGERRLDEWEALVAPWLRGLRAGTHRQRRLGAVPARRLRRGDVGAATHRPAAEGVQSTGRLGAAGAAGRLPQDRLEASPTTGSGRCAARAATSPTPR